MVLNNNITNVFCEYSIKLLLLLILVLLLIPQSLGAGFIVSPSNKIVNQGQTFDLDIYLDPMGTSVAGAQLNIEYNKSILKINNIREGDLLKQKSANTFFNGGTINNSLGKVINIFDAILGPSNVSTPGKFITINATAIGSSGSSIIYISNMKISDQNSKVVPVNLINGIIKINSSSTFNFSPTPTPGPATPLPTIIPTPANPYTISVSTSPSGLTQPAGGGQYTSGRTATVTAQSVNGYTFQKWTEGGIQVSTSAVYQFSVTKNRNLVAVYAQNTVSYTISVSASPSGLTPQPAGGGQYTSGRTATVTAQSVNGYTFQKWTEGGIQVSTSAIYQFSVAKNRNLVAVYAQNTGSLAGWWKFNNENGESSSFFRDWSNNGNNGICILTACPTLTSGKSGNALYFDGSNDYINAGNGASLDITGNITVEAWIKPGRLETAYLVKKASSGSTDGYELSLSSSTGKAYFRVNGKTSGNTYKLFSTSIFPVDGNTWVHLAGVYNRNKLQIYFNGNLENSISGPTNIISNTDNLEFGGPDDSTQV